MDVGNFVRHLCVLVLRHQMRVSNYFVNSFYSVYCTLQYTYSHREWGRGGDLTREKVRGEIVHKLYKLF
jgi:hypothetical protein